MFQVFEQARGYRPQLHAAVDGDGRVQALLLPVQVTLMNGPLRRLTTRSIAYGGVLLFRRPHWRTALEILLSEYSVRALPGCALHRIAPPVRHERDSTDAHPIAATPMKSTWIT